MVMKVLFMMCFWWKLVIGRCFKFRLSFDDMV